MALQIRQSLRQTQQLVMTPQLQQAIKLLQYNHLDMVNAVEQEVRENPLLEVAAGEEPLADGGEDTRADATALEEAVKEPLSPEMEMFGAEWENYLESYGSDYTPVNRDPDQQRSLLENLAHENENLFRYLLMQLRLSKLDDADRRIALEIIGNVDERGYLDESAEGLAETLAVDVAEVERVLFLVQEFEPRGVAARNLQECLTLQALALEPSNPLALRILEDAFDLFQRSNVEAIARALKEPLESVKEATRVIAGLEPRPGRPFSGSDTIYVIPDIYIIKVGNDYTVTLNDDGLPRLRISAFYQNQLASRSSPQGAKDYIQEKMRGAMWLIKSIHQRQRTIYKVACSILKFQREFFDKGIDYLKPLILKDVAEDIEMHESTISRVTSNKYMHTPRGIFELKYFFNSGISHGADSIASESVKNQIARIIKNEDPQKPISDKRIVDLLSASGIRIARRTVAKYREVMSIPSSSKRKKKF